MNLLISRNQRYVAVVSGDDQTQTSVFPGSPISDVEDSTPTGLDVTVTMSAEGHSKPAQNGKASVCI